MEVCQTTEMYYAKQIYQLILERDIVGNMIMQRNDLFCQLLGVCIFKTNP